MDDQLPDILGCADPIEHQINDSSSTVENKKLCKYKVIQQSKKVLALPG
jgi:hypothetical protein